MNTRVVLPPRPAVRGRRRERQVEVLAEQHQLLHHHHRRLEGDDIVLHAVDDQERILELLAVVEQRGLLEDFRVRVGRRDRCWSPDVKCATLMAGAPDTPARNMPGFSNSAKSTIMPP